MNSNTLELTLDQSPSLVQSGTEDVSGDLAAIEPENDSICLNSEFDRKRQATELKKEDDIFTANGYKKINKICDTIQGELYKASVINKNNPNKQQYVAIKRTSKLLLHNSIAVEDGTSFCVSENILKETLILKILTIDNQPIGNYIIQYRNFFQSDTDFYLVTEYIASETNLKQFILKAREYIANGTLDIKQYRKIMKYLLWQLFVIVQWLHQSMYCCHLDLCSENIMLPNATFIQTKNGIIINPNIFIKLGDFGCAEIFECNMKQKSSFLCVKQGLTLENECYVAPNVFKMDKYDARLSDNWSLGIILFECLTLGLKLYEPMTMHHKLSGYHALYTNKLQHYLITQHIHRYFKSESFALLNGLLNVHEKDRLKGMDILKQKWFEMYYQRYNKRINREFNEQKQKTVQQKSRLKEKHFPFYSDNNLSHYSGDPK